MPEIEISPIGGPGATVADSLHIMPCEEHVHIVMVDEDMNPLCEMLFDAETALSIAKRIEAAADTSLGVE